MTNFRYLLPQITACFNLRNNLGTLWSHQTSRYAALDGIRAISILMVIAFHALISIAGQISREEFQVYLESLPWFMRWLLQGDKSVEMFFVLSGFLIGCMLMKEGMRSGGKLQYGDFYYRRFLRLSPTYWILLLLILIAPIEKDKIYLLANLFYVQNFLEPENLLAGWTWTLAVEEQFYMLFPLLLSLFFFKTRHKLALLVALFLLSFPLRHWFILQNPIFATEDYVALVYDSEFFTVLYDNLYTRYGALVAGVIAAYLHCYHSDQVKQFFLQRAFIANSLLVISIVGLIWILNLPVFRWGGEEQATMMGLYHTSSRNIIAAFVAYIMMATLYGEALCRPVRWFLSWRIWLFISQMAYGLYLFHPILTLMAESAVKKTLLEGETYNLWHLWQITGLTVVLTGVFCLFTYLFVERPFMNIRDVKWRQPAENANISIRAG